MARYAKNERGYEKSLQADWEAVKKGLKKVRAQVGEPKKVPTSVALDPRLIADLKKEAKARGVPYQVLIRMFIIEGYKKMKRAG